MKPPPFRYFRPASLDEALALLEREEAKPLAGGQSLIPAMNFRLASPTALVDLNEVGELAGITESGSIVRVGAMTRHAAVERDSRIATRVPLLRETMPHVAHPQIRNRGTLGGSLAHADPAAELPAVMLALDAVVVLRSGRGERRIGANDFFTGLFATALEPAELVTAVEIPSLPPRTGWAFEEFARRHGDYALVGVAVVVTLDGRGRCERSRIVLLSVGDGPVVAANAMASFEGGDPVPESIREAAERAARDDIDPPSDIHASAAYRRQLARVLTRRALTRAVSLASGARP